MRRRVDAVQQAEPQEPANTPPRQTMTDAQRREWAQTGDVPPGVPGQTAPAADKSAAYTGPKWIVPNLREATRCNGCGGPIEVGETVVARRRQYGNGRTAKHYFCMTRCVRINGQEE
jgi:hypothetical protein